MTPRFLIVHHSGVPNIGNQFEGINHYHKLQGYPVSSRGLNCGYHFVIERTGETIQAREENEDGSHTIGHNQDAIGICLSGDTYYAYPSNEQIIALKNLLGRLQEKYQIPLENIGPHRRFQANRTCYGNLVDQWAANLVREFLGEKISKIQKLVELYQKLFTLQKKLGRVEYPCFLQNNE